MPVTKFDHTDHPVDWYEGIESASQAVSTKPITLHNTITKNSARFGQFYFKYGLTYPRIGI